jgi:hypothetical protein
MIAFAMPETRSGAPDLIAQFFAAYNNTDD